MVNESNRIYRQIEKGESVVPQLLITLSLDNRDDDPGLADVKFQLEHPWGDVPGGLVVKNPSSNAGNTGSIPGGVTKIEHAAGQLSPRVPQPLSLRTSTRESTCCKLHALWSLHTTRAHTPWNLHATTRERKPILHN